MKLSYTKSGKGEEIERQENAGTLSGDGENAGDGKRRVDGATGRLSFYICI